MKYAEIRKAAAMAAELEDIRRFRTRLNEVPTRGVPEIVVRIGVRAEQEDPAKSAPWESNLLMYWGAAHLFDLLRRREEYLVDALKFYGVGDVP